MQAWLLCRQASSFEITTEGEEEVHAFAQAGGANFGEFDLGGEVFTAQAEDGEHIGLALIELLAAQSHGIAAGGNHLGERAFAFAEVIIASERVLDVFE